MREAVLSSKLTLLSSWRIFCCFEVWDFQLVQDCKQIVPSSKKSNRYSRSVRWPVHVHTDTFTHAFEVIGLLSCGRKWNAIIFEWIIYFSNRVKIFGWLKKLVLLYDSLLTCISRTMDTFNPWQFTYLYVMASIVILPITHLILSNLLCFVSHKICLYWFSEIVRKLFTVSVKINVRFSLKNMNIVNVSPPLKKTNQKSI